MREEIANLVFPVLSYGIRLKERLAAGDTPDFADSQRELLGLLREASQAQRLSDFGGDRPINESIRGRQSDHFLGIRYALACWLDEMFILDSPWKDQWNESSLEIKLYEERERGWRFWEQADRAAGRPTGDALEVYYLCVMLGFRGDKRKNLEDLKNWCDRIKTQLGSGAKIDLPPEGQPATNVPELVGERRFHNMLTAASAALLLIIPILVFLLVFKLRG
jgi:type VI secretion system protein ImpK